VIVACGWSAYPRHLNFLRFEQIANDVSAGERSGDERGARGSGIRVLTGGTDVHLVVADLRESAVDSEHAEDRLHEIGITVNRNAVPFDPRPPMISSGLREGTSALATRGVQVEEFEALRHIIAAAIAERHPLYPYLDHPLLTEAMDGIA
jgi:glycine hydroxymethyltransferase